MEDSAARRERLRAVRAEAAVPWPEPAGTTPTPPAASLVNPLLGTVGQLPGEEASSGRFDYYTNPVSAFSGSKRRPPGFSSPPLSSWSGGDPSNYQRTAILASTHQFQVNQSPDPRSHSHISQNGPWGSPAQFGSPFSEHRGAPVSGQGCWYQSGGSSSQGYPPSPSGVGFHSPSLGRGGSPMNYPGRGYPGGSPYSNSGIGGSPMSYSGRGYPERGSPYSNFGRGGRGGRYSSNSSPRWGGGRGRYSGSSVRGEAEPLYVKSMVKDPWRKLKPIIGSILVPKTGSGSWFPESLTAKKARVDENKHKFQSGSLAEFLARSLEEATNETAG